MKRIRPEDWKPIVGYEDHYVISNYGTVRSLTREVKCNSSTRLSIGRRLKWQPSGNGYAVVRLSKDGFVEQTAVHCLVIQHFGPPQPSPSHEVNHKDCRKQNNYAGNLEWLTRSENTQHAHDNHLITRRNQYTK